ncbi:MAG TPA: hypothetical protein V6D47_19760 [Oscillatoriaceae cyanobacterium]
MRRLAGAIAALLAAFMATPSPARAVDYGGWSARVTLDGWHDDNVTRGPVLATDVLPYGNQDLGLHLGTTFGNVWLLRPDLDAWLICDLHGTAGLYYPSLDDVWGGLYGNGIWHLPGGRDATVLVGSSAFWNNGYFHVGELSFGQPLWPGATARAELGGGYYATNVADGSFWTPSVGASFAQSFATGTQLLARYAFQPRFYVTPRYAPRHELTLRVAQSLGAGFELHVDYIDTLDLSQSVGYNEGYLGSGLAYTY